MPPAALPRPPCPALSQIPLLSSLPSRSYGAFLLRDLPFDALEFVSYEQAKVVWSRSLKRDLNPGEQSLAGAFAGGFTGATRARARARARASHPPAFGILRPVLITARPTPLPEPLLRSPSKPSARHPPPPAQASSPRRWMC